MEPESTYSHTESAELHIHVLAGSQPLDRFGPPGEYLLSLTGISTDADWPANVVQDDPRIWKCAREACKLVDLWVKEPSVE